MYTEDFIKKTNNIIKAYKGYNIMKNGSKSDKFFAFYYLHFILLHLYYLCIQTICKKIFLLSS